MKTFIKLLLLTAVALLSWSAATAQEGNDAPSLIVQTEYDATGVICNGNITNQYVPVYSNSYFTSYYSNIASQWIYPRNYFMGNSGLFRDAPSGSTIKINKISFHASTSSIPNAIMSTTVEVRIGEVDDNTTTIANLTAMNNNRTAMGSPVFTGSLSQCCSGQTMTITLDTPYEYTGHNLIVDIYVGETSNATCQWYGVNSDTDGTSCYYYRGAVTGNNFNTEQFLPKMTVDFSYTKWESPETIDFGGVQIGNTKTLQAKINNPGAETTAILSTTQPFAVNPTTLNLVANEETPFTLTFTPTQSISYSGNLNLEINGHAASVPMRGVGFKEGEKAIRDRAFFEDIEYTWKEWRADGSGPEHTSNLGEIATDPDQIIAMLKEVYTNRTIPGNYKRGYSSTGGSDHDDVVTYTGVGKINSSYAYEDSYGWDIPGNVLSGNNYRYMDPDQYKPYYEGVTLLLLEIVDTFTPTSTGGTPTHDYKKLRDYFEASIKSARIVTEAKRVGNEADAFSPGTLFKIDCDKMNKFYLIAKGQLSWHKESNYNTTGYGYPLYYSTNYYDSGLGASYLRTEPAFLCHMFEQLSPSEGNSEDPLSDGYQMFVTEMKSFGIKHDCPNVPFVNSGHHFMMYGPNSLSADCQDIRDMMLLVPDYRMLDWTGRGTSGSSGSNRSQDYFYYHQNHQPSVGVFVIHQDEITDAAQVSGKNLYKHSLKWRSNLDDFLPGKEQEYELWEVVVDDFGVESYQRVYYRNANGDYTDKDGNVVTTPVPIVLDRVNLSNFTYADVYVDMTDGSQTKTYVIRGRDKEHFLSLQMSNQQEVFIPGLDPKEKAHMVVATYYSRFNPDNQKNCYSNRLELTNNGMTLTTSDLSKNLYFYRLSRPAQLDANGNVITDDEGNIQYANDATRELVATGTASNNVLTITIANPIDDSEYPHGKEDKKSAGYHANTTLSFRYSTQNGFIRFTDAFKFWDNFTVDVSKNAHPLQYLYRMEVGSPDNPDAYSNNVRVPIYKTDSKINDAISLDDVLEDTQMSDDYSPEDVEFQAKVQMSSKTEILRYDAYRWLESEKRYIVEEGGDNDEDEEDFDPTGIAGNQGGWYTVSMNENTKPYYYVAPDSELPTVDEANPTNWATFVDKYPTYVADSSAYIYAPAVELFTKGYYENNKVRKDYNTYGGPLKNVAFGKMKVTVAEPDADHPQMSDYKWFNDDNGEWYSYYTIYLQFDTLNIPVGYELYKLRAWRKVDKDLLGEEVGTRQSRVVDGWYMYEDMNFGDDLGEFDRDGNHVEAYMSKDELASGSYYLGHRSNTVGKPYNPDGSGGGPVFATDNTSNPNAGENVVVEDLIDSEVRATFGALRMKTPDDDSGSLTELDASFKVRAYFTKTNNPLITPSRDGETQPMPGSDFDYYIVEGIVDNVKLESNNIITGIGAVKMDVNREVVGVTYVNPVGQASSTPWSGINIVVTRYSDGSTTTKKIIK